MAQWFIVLLPLVETPGLVPRTHMVANNPHAVFSSVLEDLMLSSSLLGHLYSCSAQTSVQIKHPYAFKKIEESLKEKEN